MPATALPATARVPPGPRGNLLLGVMPEFNADALAFVTRCARDYGDVVSARFLYVDTLFLYHPDHVEFMLTSGNRNFKKPLSLNSAFFRRIVGNGLITSEGDFWLRQRRLAQPAFHRERLASYADTVARFAERLIENWQDGETREIHADMMRVTREAVAKILFDADVTMDAGEMERILAYVVEPFGSQATLKWILDNRLPTPAHRRFDRTVRRLDEIVYRIIAERRADPRDRDDLLSMLLHAQDEDGTRMTDRQLRDEAMTLFLAGHETTAISLSWAWYLLSQNPAAEERLHAELGEVLPGRAPTFADLPRLRYAENVVRESMRLYPPAWGVGREAVRDCEIGGYRVPRGTQLFAFQWVTHRDERFFERPEEFLPERWTEDFARRLPKFAYFPFGGGPRVCIGQQLAMMEATLILATLARRFRLRLAPGHHVRPFPALTLRPRDGVKVVLEKR